MSCTRIKLSNSQSAVFDGLETANLFHNFAQNLALKNAKVTNSYFNLLDATGRCPTLLLNENTKAKQKRSGRFQSRNNRSFNDKTLKVLLLMNLCETFQKPPTCHYPKLTINLQSNILYTSFPSPLEKSKKKDFCGVKKMNLMYGSCSC